MGGKGRDIRWRGEGNYRGRNHRGSNVAIINQPFLRDNVFGVGLKPRIPLTPLAWRFANFLEFLYIIDDENIRGLLIAPTTSFHPWMKLVSFLFFIIIISFFPKKRKTIRTFPPLWRFFHAEVSLSSFLRERGKYLFVVEKEKEGTFEAVDVAKTQALFHIDALSIFHGNRVPGQTRIYQRVRWYVAS